MATNYSPGQITSQSVTTDYSPHQVESGVLPADVPMHTSGSTADYGQAMDHASMHAAHGHAVVQETPGMYAAGTHTA
jgi:hypothetical protein